MPSSAQGGGQGGELQKQERGFLQLFLAEALDRIEQVSCANCLYYRCSIACQAANAATLHQIKICS